MKCKKSKGFTEIFKLDLKIKKKALKLLWCAVNKIWFPSKLPENASKEHEGKSFAESQTFKDNIVIMTLFGNVCDYLKWETLLL